MIWKIITLAGAAFALWSFVQRAVGATHPPARRRAAKDGGADDYIQCKTCGSWKPAGGDCACSLPPTP